MATPKLGRFEIWSNLQCLSGTRLGVIPDWMEATEARSLTGEERIDVTLPRNSSAWPNLREQRVLRSVFTDGSFDEWRITKLLEERRPDGGITSSIGAVSPLIDLATVAPTLNAIGSLILADFEIVGQTITQHFNTYISGTLTSALGGAFTLGTVDDNSPLNSVQYSWTTPLQACLQMANAKGLELRLRRNGTAGYFVDFLTSVGASAPKLYVRLGSNLQGVRRTRLATDQATVVFPRGQATDGIYATMAEALWKVATTPTGTTFTVQDIAGGAGPIAFDSQLTNQALYVRKFPSGSGIAITADVASTQLITTGSAHGLAPGDYIQFWQASTRFDLLFLRSPQDYLTYGWRAKILDLQDIPGTVNYVVNPAMRVYTTGANAPPDNWEIIPGCGLAAANVDKDTGVFRFGGASAKCVLAGDGQGIGTIWTAIAPTDEFAFVSGQIGFRNITDGAKVRLEMLLGITTVAISGTPTRATSGGITTVSVTTSAAHNLALGNLVEMRSITGATTADGYNGVRVVSRIVSSTQFEYQLTADPGVVSVSSATIRRVWKFATPGSPTSQQFIDLNYAGVNAKTLGATVACVRVMQDGTTGCTVYADSGQVTPTAVAQSFIEGSGGAQLWQAGNRKLLVDAPPAVEYGVDMLDRGRLDSSRWPYEDVILGQQVQIDDPEWGLSASTRVVGYTRDLRLDAKTALTLSTQNKDITDLLARPGRVGRQPVPDRPTSKRTTYTVRLSANKFVPLTSADFANIKFFNGGLQGMFVGSGVTGQASMAILDDVLVRGARIRAFRFDAQGIIGITQAKLYRDSTILSSLSTNGALFSDTTLNQLIGTESYWVWADLTGTNPGSACSLYWIELDLEVDG